jgi:hypothetical protein
VNGRIGVKDGVDKGKGIPIECIKRIEIEMTEIELGLYS